MMMKMLPDTDGVRDLFIFMMVNNEPSMYRTNALETLLNHIASEVGFSGWVEAYHKL